MTPKRAAAALVCVLAVSVRCFAIADGTTMSDALAAALARYPEAQLSAAIDGEVQAWERAADSVFADVATAILRHANDDPNHNQGLREWEWGIALPLWMPEQRSSRRGLAAAKGSEAAALSALIRWRVAGELRERLWAVLIAEAGSRQAERAFESARKLEADVDRRVTAGELARADLLLAGDARLRRESERVTARAELEAAERQYRVLVGDVSLPRDHLETPAEADSIDATLAAHPLVGFARAEDDSLRAEYTRLNSDRAANPMLELTARHEKAESGYDYVDSINVELRFPLGASHRSGAEFARASRQAAESSARLARQVRELRLAIVEARHDLDMASEVEALASKRNELAESSLRLARRSFELGESSLFELLRSTEQSNEARRDFELAVLERGRAAARLNQAMGVLP
jgi:outer membrane protein TolC